MSCETSTPLKDIAVSIAGPLGSAAMLTIGAVMQSKVMICANFSLLAVNLIPALPLDGGRILRIILLRKNGILKAKKITKIFSFVCSALLLAVGVLLKSVWLVTIAGVIVFECRSSLNVTECITKCKKNLPVKQIEITGSIKPYKIIRYISPYYRLSVKGGGEVKYEEEIIGLKKNMLR